MASLASLVNRFKKRKDELLKSTTIDDKIIAAAKRLTDDKGWVQRGRLTIPQKVKRDVKQNVRGLTNTGRQIINWRRNRPENVLGRKFVQKTGPVGQAIVGATEGLGAYLLPERIYKNIPQPEGFIQKAARFSGGVAGFSAGPGKFIYNPLEGKVISKLGQPVKKLPWLMRKAIPAIMAESATSAVAAPVKSILQGKPLKQSFKEELEAGLTGRAVFGSAGPLLEFMTSIGVKNKATQRALSNLIQKAPRSIKNLMRTQPQKFREFMGLTQNLTKEDIKLFADFTSKVEAGKYKGNLGEVGSRVQKILDNLPGDFSTVGNKEAANVLDFIAEAGKIKQGDYDFGFSIKSVGGDKIKIKLGVAPEFSEKEIGGRITTRGQTLQELPDQTKRSYKDIISKSDIDVKAKVNILDYFRTPQKVLEKIGLGKQAEGLRVAHENYLEDLDMEIARITEWAEQTPGADSSKKIFQWLDGNKSVELNDVELKIAGEIRQYLSEWADKLGLPEDQRMAEYITHVFNFDKVQKEFDPDIAEIIADRVPGSVYNPFLEKRLGKLGYVEDVWRALDAYTKRAVRKFHMDPALKKLQTSAEDLDLTSYRYVKKLGDRINMRPTELESLIDNAIKSSPVGYRFGGRPLIHLSRKFRQAVYRGALGLNVGSATKNLTQGINTFAKLGTKYAGIGYARLVRELSAGNLDELNRVGVLQDGLIQDRNPKAIKSLVQKTDKVLFLLFDLAEKINRGAAYYGAKAKGLAEGMTEKEAMEFAKKIVRDTQFTFGKIDTPLVLSDETVKTLLQFQSYNIKQAEFLGEMIKNNELGGLIRWTGASLAMIATIGKALGMDYKDLIPTLKMQSPFTQMAGAGIKITSGDEGDRKKGRRDLLKSGILLVPGGAQAQKTVQGLQSFMKGASYTPSGRKRFDVEQTPGVALRVATLGQWSLPQAKEYVKGGFKTVKSAELSTTTLPTTDKDLATTYKTALKIVEGYGDKKIKIQSGLGGGDLSDLQAKVDKAIRIKRQIEQQEPEKVFKIKLDTYASGAGMLVSDRAKWVAEELEQVEGEEFDQTVNKMLEAKVLTKSVAEALRDEYGINVGKYTSGGKIKSLSGSSSGYGGKSDGRASRISITGELPTIKIGEPSRPQGVVPQVEGRSVLSGFQPIRIKKGGSVKLPQFKPMKLPRNVEAFLR